MDLTRAATDLKHRLERAMDATTGADHNIYWAATKDVDAVLAKLSHIGEKRKHDAQHAIETMRKHQAVLDAK